MNKIVKLLVVSLFFITSCATVHKQETVPQKVVQEIKSNVENIEQGEVLNFSVLSGYFLKNNIKLLREINFFTVDSSNKFKNVIGITKTRANSIVVPNFNDEIVIIIAMKPSRNFNLVSIKRVCMLDDNMYVDCEIKEEEAKELGYFISNVYMFKVQKPKVIVNVCFMNGDKQVVILPFGNRTINSPINVSDMLRNYTGVYKGTFPVSNTENIMSVELDLKSDYTFYLKQTYLTLNGKTFESIGKWYTTSDLSSFILNKNKNLSFYFKDKNTIEKLDDNGEKINPEKYTLKK
ncbi:MAG: copper resistance protein NlpE [Endomicrobium sp.]|jgi:hypothetical protein|nr:copper resistance protein NlpE [Endomicrobium sp.]